MIKSALPATAFRLTKTFGFDGTARGTRLVAWDGNFAIPANVPQLMATGTALGANRFGPVLSDDLGIFPGGGVAYATGNGGNNDFGEVALLVQPPSDGIPTGSSDGILLGMAVTGQATSAFGADFYLQFAYGTATTTFTKLDPATLVNVTATNLTYSSTTPTLSGDPSTYGFGVWWVADPPLNHDTVSETFVTKLAATISYVPPAPEVVADTLTVTDSDFESARFEVTIKTWEGLVNTWLEYGTTSGEYPLSTGAYGIAATAQAYPPNLFATGRYGLVGLEENTTYYVRVAVENPNGIDYSDEISFTTPQFNPNTDVSKVSVVF